jgi:hypothetical protein
VALAYYERPGREGWIAAARQRFLQAPVVPLEPGTPKPSEMLGMEPVTNAEVATTTTPQPVRRRRLIATTLVACAALAALVVLQTRTTGTNTFAEGWTTLQSAAGRVADAGRSLVNSVSGHSKPTTTGDDGKKPATEPAPTTDRPRSGRKARLQVASLAEENPETVTAGIQDVPVDAQAVPSLPAAGDAAPATSTPALTPAETVPVTNDAGTVGSDQIVPPRLLDPVRLPPWARPGAQASTNVIELDIASTGSVRRVRLLSTPTRLTDMMILSAAKTWVFEPASSRGRAVPYTLTLNWVPPNR